MILNLARKRSGVISNGEYATTGHDGSDAQSTQALWGVMVGCPVLAAGVRVPG